MIVVSFSEILKVEEHKACLIVLVFFCEKLESAFFIKGRCRAQSIYCKKAASQSLYLGKCVHDIAYNHGAKTAAGIIFIYGQTANFNSWIILAAFVVRYVTVYLIPCRFFFGIEGNLVSQKAVISDGNILVGILQKVCHRH